MKGLIKRGKYYYVQIRLDGVLHRKATRTTCIKEAKVVRDNFRDELLAKKEEVEARKRRARASEYTDEEILDVVWETKWSRQVDGEASMKRVNHLIGTLIPEILRLPPGTRAAFTMIQSGTIMKVVRVLMNRGLAHGTINTYLSNLRYVLGVAAKLEVIDSVPVYSRLKTRTRTRIWTPEEVNSALEYFQVVPKRSERIALKGKVAQYRLEATTETIRALHDLIVILRDTGMRLGEPLAIRYGKHIDFENDTINLTEDITKTAQPRMLNMTEATRKVLWGRRIDYPIQPFPYINTQFRHQLEQFKKAKGINDPDLCLHGLRHYGERYKMVSDDSKPAKPASYSSFHSPFYHERPSEIRKSIRFLSSDQSGSSLVGRMSTYAASSAFLLVSVSALA